MTSSAFSPNRMTTMPPTTSPRPSSSAIPRRMSGPSRTDATSATRIGVPRALDADGDLLDVAERGEIAAAAHHVLAAGELEQPPLDLVVARGSPDHVLPTGRRRRAGSGSSVTWYCLTKPPMLGDLGHPRDAREPVAQVPVLEAAQLGEVVLAGLVHQRVLNTQPTPVASGPSDGLTLSGSCAADPLEVLDDAAARPVDVGAVLEDHVDVRDPEVGEAAHRPDARRGEQRRDDRIGDLVLDEVGAAPRPLGGR
jgi:hypothetical protein